MGPSHTHDRDHGETEPIIDRTHHNSWSTNLNKPQYEEDLSLLKQHAIEAVEHTASGYYVKIGTHPFSGAFLPPGFVAVALWIVSYSILTMTDLIVLPAVIGVTALFSILYDGIALRFGVVEPEEAALLGTFEQRFGVDLDSVRIIAKRLAG